MLQAAALFSLVVTLVVGLIRPAVMLAFLISMFAVEQLMMATTPIFLATSWLLNVISALAGGLTLVVLAFQRPEALRGAFTPTAVTTVALFVFAALSVLWTRNPARAVALIEGGAPYAVVIIGIAPLLVNDMLGLEKFAKAMLIIGLVVTIQLLANPSFQLYSARFVLELDASTRSNPLVLGSMGGLMLVIGVVANFGGGQLWKLLRLASVFTGLGIALLSGSRGQVMGAVIVCVLIYPLSRQISDYRRFFGSVIGLAVMIGVSALAIQTFVGSANEARWDSESLGSGTAGRLDNSMDLLTEWIRSPASYVIGLGYASFEVLPTNRGGDTYTHVMLADSLGELGVIGLGLYCAVFVFALRDGFRLLSRYRDDPRGRSMVATLIALLLYSFLLQNKQGTLYGIDPTWIFAILLSRFEYHCAAAAALDSIVDEQEDDEFDDEVVDVRDGPLPIASHASS